MPVFVSEQLRLRFSILRYYVSMRYAIGMMVENIYRVMFVPAILIHIINPSCVQVISKEDPEILAKTRSIYTEKENIYFE